jgi:hypothetical protein
LSPQFRKIALIAASLGLLVSLFVALRPDDDEDAATTAPAATAPATTTEPPPTTTATTTTAPTTTAPTTTAPKPPTTATIRIVVKGGRPVGGIRRATVKRGRKVALIVVSDVADHIHLHGYDLLVDVAPGQPSRIRFDATVAGRFELELEDRGVLLAELQVRP